MHRRPRSLRARSSRPICWALTSVLFSALLHGCDERADSTDYETRPPSPTAAPALPLIASVAEAEPSAPPDTGNSIESVRQDPYPSESESLDDVGGIISFDPPLLDFGRVLAGSVVSREVWIINASETAVTVLETHSTCGCTVAHMTERTINPGDGIPTRVQLTVPRRVSSIRKQVRFRFADGQPDQVLSVRAEAIEPVVLTPRYARVGGAKPTAVVLESADGRAFRILGTTPSILAQSIDGPAATRHEIRIDEVLWNAAGQPPRIDLALDHPEAALISLSVRAASSTDESPAGQVAAEPRITVTPPPRLLLSADRLRFGDISADSPGEADLTILGSFALGVLPEIEFESVLAELTLVNTNPTVDGLTVTLRLTAKPGSTGYVRSPLMIRIGAARAWCDVLATVN